MGCDNGPTPEECLAFWRRAEAIARRRCGRTLARLARGEGGFYEADDLMQDLFLAFRELLWRWWQRPGRREEALWAAWERLLWGGGIGILRRRPQRLWTAPEVTVSPEALALDESAETPSELPASAREGLITHQDAEEGGARLACLDALEGALWQLSPLQRQALYLAILEGLPRAEVARRLGLKDAQSAYGHIHRARRALRRALGRS